MTVVIAMCLAASSRIAAWNEERLLEEKVYGEDHQLSRMAIMMIHKNETKEAFFFLSGKSYNNSIRKTTITFNWELEGEYIISDLPRDKIRMRFDDDQEVPTIKFVKKFCHDGKKTMQERINCIEYAVVTCKSKDSEMRII